VYEVHQFATEGIVVRADSEIEGLADLRGKTIGLASDRDQMTTIIALETVGIDISEVTTVVVGESGPILAAALRDGTIDAFAGGSSDRAGIEAAGVQFRNITPAAVSEVPGNSFVMLEERKEELAEVARAFLKGWAMATHAGVVDTNTVISICRDVLPEQFERLS
jgi:NitT/TauT family transport system substrate-binding protein